MFRLDLPPTAKNEWESDEERRKEVERVDAQLVVHAFDQEENLVLFDSKFVFCARLGLVVVGGLEDGDVRLWIVGHVGGGVRLRSQS